MITHTDGIVDVRSWHYTLIDMITHTDGIVDMWGHDTTL